MGVVAQTASRNGPGRDRLSERVEVDESFHRWLGRRARAVDGEEGADCGGG
jgi:hypothetical protein